MQKFNLIFISACAGMLLFGISVITLGSLAQGLQEKFNLDAISAGTLFSILPFGILTGSLIFGPISDRYGYKYFLVLSSLCMFIGFQGIAYSSSMIILKICVFLFGFGGGAINGATNAVVSDISKSNKGANLSLLGIFYAIGALGMPFILGALQAEFSFEAIISAVGYVSVFIAGLFMATPFPAPKQTQGIPVSQGLALAKEDFILLIGFFLFCQSSFEALVNNWTTTYLSKELFIPGNKALFALSLHVVGMAAMRLVIGGFMRNSTPRTILFICFTFLLAGCLLLQFATSFASAVVALISLGIGLCAGFPIMMGLVGSRYSTLSGTAFSIVLFIALSGNMIINFVMGLIVDRYGIQHLTTVSFILWSGMMMLSLIILKKNKS